MAAPPLSLEQQQVRASTKHEGRREHSHARSSASASLLTCVGWVGCVSCSSLRLAAGTVRCATQRDAWSAEQQQLRTRLVTTDDLGFDWPLQSGSRDSGTGESTEAAAADAPALLYASSPDLYMSESKSDSEASSAVNRRPSLSPPAPLTLVGGMDISFVGDGADDACAALIVCEFPPQADGSMRIVYEDYERVVMKEQYMPGFLAFREVPHLLRLLDRMRIQAPHLFPQIVLVDGNGRLHPRGFGLACQLGVLADVPTIGIGKNLHMVDGLERDTVSAHANSTLKRGGQSFPLVGSSGTVWGACLRSTHASSNPIFVSIGHRISLDTAVLITHACCQHRIPTPVRMADLRSRQVIRQWKSA
jgi:deoxyinosine 3'endonuclease (endonuclease V)